MLTIISCKRAEFLFNSIIENKYLGKNYIAMYDIDPKATGIGIIWLGRSEDVSPKKFSCYFSTEDKDNGFYQVTVIAKNNEKNEYYTNSVYDIVNYISDFIE